jgi:hypothetical protein
MAEISSLLRTPQIRPTAAEPTLSATAADRKWSVAYARLATVTVIVLGIGLRALFLDADPHYYDWIGYITDEGRWIDQARELALFGRMLEPDQFLHVLVAPLFQLASYIVFALSNVSVLSSRLLSAVSGCLMLVTFWIAFRRNTTPEALLLGIVPLALQVDLVTLSRLAVPEVTSMALQLFLYLAMTSRNSSALRYFGAGLTSLLVVGMKITAAPVVAIFSLFLVRPPIRSYPTTDRRWAAFLAFVAGLAGPLLILALVVLAGRPQLLHSIYSTIGRVWGFLGVSEGYSAISFPFESPLAPALNLWGLAFWYALIGWRAAPSAAVDPESRRYFVTSALWSALYGGTMLLLSYFPDRYKVHILLPMCITVAIGVGLLQRAGLIRIESAFAESRGLGRPVNLALFGLPAAILVSPLLAAAIGVVGVETFRLRAKVLTLAASVVAMTLVLEWCCRRQRRLTFFVLFPVVAALPWFVVQRSGIADATFWPTESSPFPALIWLALLLAAGIVSAAVAARARGPALTSLQAGIVLSATGYALVALVQLAPGYFSPHYTIRDTSRQLGTLLAGLSGPVASSDADGLFRENTLPYTLVSEHRWRSDKPEVVVTVFASADLEHILAEDYCQIGAYPLYVAPEYYRAHPTFTPASSLGEIARVYRRRVALDCSSRVNP